MRTLGPNTYPPMTAYQARQIEGPSQVAQNETCDAETRFVPVAVVQTRLDEINHHLEMTVQQPMGSLGSQHLRLAASALLALAEELREDAEHTADFPCDWTGDVDVAVWSTGRFTADTEWTCPRCGTTHEGERDATDDCSEHYADQARDDR